MFILPAVDVCLGHLQVLVIVNNAALNIGIPVSLGMAHKFSILLGILRSGIAGPVVAICLTF